jgi:hypothetical protein
MAATATPMPTQSHGLVPELEPVPDPPVDDFVIVTCCELWTVAPPSEAVTVIVSVPAALPAVNVTETPEVALRFPSESLSDQA